MKNGVIHTTSFHYKYHAQDSCLHPGGLLPGCRERRPRRDRGGATGTVAASQGFASGMEARQGGDSFAGSVHDSPPHQGDARKSHKQERNGKKRKKRKRKKKKNSNRHGNHRKITSEKNIPDTSQTGRVTGDASAWPSLFKILCKCLSQK